MSDNSILSNMKEDSCTAYFIAPALGLDSERVYVEPYETVRHRLVVNGRFADSGDKVYIVYSSEPSSDLDEYLRGHERFDRKFILQGGKPVYVFSLTEEEVEGVAKPVSEGKYSKIDRAVADRVFPLKPGHRFFVNRLVIERSPLVRLSIEQDLGVVLGEDAELWERYHPHREWLVISQPSR